MAKQCWGESLTINGDCSRECSAVALPFGQACFVSILTYEDLGVKTDTASAGAFYDRCASPAPTPEPAPAPGSAAPPVSDAEASQWDGVAREGAHRVPFLQPSPADGPSDIPRPASAMFICVWLPLMQALAAGCWTLMLLAAAALLLA